MERSLDCRLKPRRSLETPQLYGSSTDLSRKIGGETPRNPVAWVYLLAEPHVNRNSLGRSSAGMSRSR
jgi:hypothetical protein